MRYLGFIFAVCSLAVLPACSADPPLIFGRIDILGISAAATAPDQGANLVLGYRSAKLAVVPVTVRDANGNVQVLRETRQGANTSEFSTFAHFEASSAAALSSGVSACLGDTFATGLAAQAISERI
jgi:hypothetical protein